MNDDKQQEYILTWINDVIVFNITRLEDVMWDIEQLDNWKLDGRLLGIHEVVSQTLASLTAVREQQCSSKPPQYRDPTIEDATAIQQMLAKSLVGQFDDFSPENFATALKQAGFVRKVQP